MFYLNRPITNQNYFDLLLLPLFLSVFFSSIHSTLFQGNWTGKVTEPGILTTWLRYCGLCILMCVGFSCINEFLISGFCNILLPVPSLKIQWIQSIPISKSFQLDLNSEDRNVIEQRISKWSTSCLQTVTRTQYQYQNTC